MRILVMNPNTTASMIEGHCEGYLGAAAVLDRLFTAGPLQRCAGVRGTGLGVLQLEEDRERTVETAVGLGLSASKVRSFAPPRPKAIGSCPLGAHLPQSPGSPSGPGSGPR